jgi:hypothetical protein
MGIVSEIIDFGYPQQYILTSIKHNEINYSTASYYILKKRAMIDNSHHLLPNP